MTLEKTMIVTSMLSTYTTGVTPFLINHFLSLYLKELLLK